MARLDFSTRDVVEVAAQGGGADALYQLGLMYCTGREVDIDLVSAHKWFNLAAMRGNDDAKRYRIELASEMTKAQVSSAQKAAREWLKRH